MANSYQKALLIVPHFWDPVCPPLGVASLKPYAEVKRWHEPTQKVSVAFITINGVQLELIEPASEDSPIMEYLNKKQSIYHICYRVDDIEEAMRLGREHGFHSFTKPMPAVAYEGKPYV